MLRPAPRLRQAVVLLVGVVCVGAVHADALLRIETHEINSGQTDVPIPVRLDNEDPVYAFQLSIVSDPALLAIRSVTIEYGIAEAAGMTGFSGGFILEDGSHVSWGVVIDLSEPFDPSSFLPAGESEEIARLILDVVGMVEEETVTTLRFEDRPADTKLGTPAALNKVVREEGVPIDLVTEDGEVAIAPEQAPIFLRGNSNHDDAFDLSDGVYTLNFLFNGGPTPLCLDAADTTDDGIVDLSDPVYSFNTLFLGGPEPGSPYPEYGPDPTEDPLDCASSQPM